MSFLRLNVNYLALGFLLALALFNLSSCPDETAAPADENETYQESSPLKDFSGKVKTAFASGIADSVLSLTLEDYRADCRKYLNGNAEKMVKFAEALNNRKLLFANEKYAEYELQADGYTFTIAYCRIGDGSWQLMRY